MKNTIGSKILTVIFVPFLIIFATFSLYIYLTIEGAGGQSSAQPLAVLLPAVSVVLLLALLTVFIYVTRKISRPIKELTLSADEISQGNLETNVAFFSASQGEIGVLSRSLHRMVEQFRVHTLMQERLQQETSLRGKFFLATQFPDTSDALSELSLMLCEHFDMFRVSFVLLSGGRALVEACCQSGRTQRSEIAPDFLHHTQVADLLSPGRKLVFLNSFALTTHELQFLHEDTVSLYILPLRKEGELRGYVTLENNDRRKAPGANVEHTLLYITRMITDWLPSQSARVQGSETSAKTNGAIKSDCFEKACCQTNTQNGDFISAAKKISGLCVDLALETMGGMRDIYEHSAQLMAHTSPKTISAMDDYLSRENTEAFGIEVHGIKGALNNIGAIELGSMASRIEAAAKSGDLEYCKEHYTDFRAALVTLLDDLSAAIPGELSSADKSPGDPQELSEALRAAAAAAKGYDSLDAQELLSPASTFTYGAQVDEMLADTLFALKAFDCEKALEGISKLEEVLNNG